MPDTPLPGGPAPDMAPAPESTRADLAHQLEQQKLMTAMARLFISSEDRNTVIDRALAMVGGFFGIGMIILSRFDVEGNLLHFERVWTDAGRQVPPLGRKSQPISHKDGVYVNFVVKGLTHFACDDTAVLNDDNAIKAMGVRSFVSAAVHVDGRIWGVLSFDEMRGPRHWSDGDVQLMLMLTSIIAGVVERGATEARLQRMSSIVGHSPQYISYVSADGQYEYLNHGAEVMTGYTREELTMLGFAVLFDDETYRRIVEEIIPEIQVRGQVDFEAKMTRKDGQKRVMAFSSFTAGGGQGAIGTIARDITVERRLERDLVAARDEAEAARDQAQQASLAKSNFLSRMSHEMRTPMNAIIGMTHIAKGSGDPQRVAYCLDKIDEASTHLLGVINDILDVSKIESGKFELSPVAFSLEQTLQRVTGVMGFRVSEKRQKLTVRLDRAVPKTLVADEQRLAQVLTNLLGNAVKFTPDGGQISLDITEQGCEGEVHTLLFTVRDTGIGLTGEQLGRLFLPFEQAEGGVARKYGGTGLGLAISKSIVEMMGGRIWAESAPGQGATFAFSVPVKKGRDPDPLALSGICWEDLRVLAVDDAPEVREYFTEVAESLGLACQVVGSGDEAVAHMAQDAPYNIVFVDWSMPGMDGIELTRRIRERYGAGAVVIMISGTEWENIEAEARGAGVDGFLQKPLFPSQIVNCINTYMGPGAAACHRQNEVREEGLFAGKHILLAEDIEVNREIVQALLAHTGVSLDDAWDGRQAVEMFAADPARYDLILMDIHMPEVDGYEATGRIRALAAPQAKTVPIIAMTANVFREDVEQCLAAGMNGHVGKPVDGAELMAVLRRWLAP